MTASFTINQNKVTFQVQLTDVMDDHLDTSDIANVWIVFWDNFGTREEKVATLEDDPLNPGQVFNIVDIRGNGIDDTITVELSVEDMAKLEEGELVAIVSPSGNFGVAAKPISIIDATHFTYQRGSPGNVTPDASGTVTTPGEKLITYVDSLTTILDLIGVGEFGARVKLTDGADFGTFERTLFQVL